MTFSLTARCPVTGAFGIAISSSSPAVAARCVHLRPGVGASASQNITDPRLGGRLLDRLDAGDSAAEAMAAVVTADPTAGYRQLTVVDAAGRVAGHSGRHMLGTHHLAFGDGAVAAGNLLACTDVIDVMLAAFGHPRPGPGRRAGLRRAGRPVTAKDQARARIGIDSLPAVDHQPEFAVHCAGPAADRAVLDGATALAATVIDAATRDNVRDRLLHPPGPQRP